MRIGVNDRRPTVRNVRWYEPFDVFRYLDDGDARYLRVRQCNLDSDAQS